MVKYKVPRELGTSYQNREKDEARFELWFTKPIKVKVKEEYLIYDFVSMIGAIGGTLGLCIGFSFLDLTRPLIGLTRSCLRRTLVWLKNMKGHTRRNVKDQAICEEEIHDNLATQTPHDKTNSTLVESVQRLQSYKATQHLATHYC